MGLDTGGWAGVAEEAWGFLTVSVLSGKQGAGTPSESEDGGRGAGSLETEVRGLIHVSI